MTSKSLVAQITFVRPCTGMDQHMSLHIATLKKSLLAHNTFMPFFTGVPMSVHSQIIGSHKCLCTNVAYIAFLTMNALVSRQVTLFTKSLVTHFTEQASVNSFVRL